jgi:hypothetical protein
MLWAHRQSRNTCVRKIQNKRSAPRGKREPGGADEPRTWSEIPGLAVACSGPESETLKLALRLEAALLQST